MKIAAERSTFAEALARVKDSAGNQTMPICDNVKIETVGEEAVRLTATNLDTTISTIMRGQVSEQGRTTVPIKLLVQMVNSLTASIVELSCDERTDSKAKLVGGDTKFSLARTPVEQFPKPDTVGGDGVTIGQKTLRDLIGQTAYATSSDNTRRSLMGINLYASSGRLFAVAADGHRFAISSASFDGDQTWNIILPPQSFKCLRSCLATEGDVRVRIKDRSAALFETDGWTLQTKLIDEQYPDVTSKLPRIDANTVEVDRVEFSNALRQASVTSSAVGANHVAITVRSGVVRLTSTDNEISDSEILLAVKYDGEECTFRMNPKFVLDALSQFADDTVLFRFVNASRPVEFTVGDGTSYAQFLGLRV